MTLLRFVALTLAELGVLVVLAAAGGVSGRVPYRPGLIRSTSGSGLVAQFPADLALWRHLYRVLRRAGVPAWKARYDLWTLAFDACTAAEYVSVRPYRTEAGAL